MSLHPEFPRSPYEVLSPALRWFPAAEELRNTAYEKLLPPLVAKIREEVKAWRDAGYAGASATSRALLAWWFPAKYTVKSDDEKREPLALIEEAERFFTATGAVFRHGGNRAFYAPSADFIQLPPAEAFKDAESYAATKAHELTHWSGHERRLARSFGKRFGDQAYAFEELVAELGAAFLCAGLGITPEPREDHAAYLAHWLDVLKQDKRAIFTAAAHAQRAADFLAGLAAKKAEDQAEPLAA
jgi:antirestriction protein ArdC